MDTTIDTDAFMGNIADIADIAIYLQDGDTADTASNYYLLIER